MAATIRQIRTALQARLVAYYAAGTQPIQVYDTVPGAAQERCVVVEPASGSFHSTFGANGGTDHQFSVHAMVSMGDRDAAQNTLDEMISETGAASVAAGIEADRTLGGVVRWADPQGYRDYGTRSFGDTTYLMATLDILIFAQ